jgi:CBS domain-containing protein
MKVRDIMNWEVITCRPDTTLTSAARLMRQAGVGTLPVIDDDGHVAGILTDRDIAMAAASHGRNASHIIAREAMSPNVRTCHLDEDLRMALKYMEESRVRRLPVLNSVGLLVGIVSMDDIVLRAIGQENGIGSAEFVRTLRGISSPSLKRLAQSDRPAEGRVES